MPTIGLAVFIDKSATDPISFSRFKHLRPLDVACPENIDKLVNRMELTLFDNSTGSMIFFKLRVASMLRRDEDPVTLVNPPPTTPSEEYLDFRYRICFNDRDLQLGPELAYDAPGR